jgi:hypothetical protein
VPANPPTDRIPWRIGYRIVVEVLDILEVPENHPIRAQLRELFGYRKT